MALRHMAAVLPEVFPWAAFLPSEDVVEFAKEFVTVAHAAESLGNLSPVTQLITEWRHTAEVYADPTLHHLLLRETEDHGVVAEPEVKS